MANIKYSDLLMHVLPELPGCSSPLAESNLRSAVITLCRHARMWLEDLDVMRAVIGTPTYDIDLPVGTSLVQIRSIHYDGGELIAAEVSGQLTETGTPEYYAQRTPEQFSLVPTPNSAGAVAMTVALAPSQQSTAFPAWIAEQYHEAITAGAKARLFLMPGHTWSNEQLGSYYDGIFKQAMRAAYRDAQTSFVRATQRTQSHH